MKFKKKNPICMHDEMSVYEALREAYRGGNVHMNKQYANEIHKITAFDKSSHYPNVMIHRPMPITPFKLEKYITNEQFEYIVEKEHFACLVKMKIKNLRLKHFLNPCPYISKSKCRNIVGLGQCFEKMDKFGNTRLAQNNVVGEVDNGRICYCQYMETTITDIDFRIMKSMYDFEYEIVTLWLSEYGYLPPEFRRYLIKLYKAKTELKNIPGHEVEYINSKVDINSCYGLFVEAFLKDTIFVDDDGEVCEIFNENKPYYDRKAEYEEVCEKRTLPYRIGVFVCAWARYEYQEGVDAMEKAANESGKGGWIYGDTDSNFGIGDFRPVFDELNKKYIERAKKSGAYATDHKGITHYCGAWEYEDKKEGNFKGLGCKKYAIETEKGVTITVAGIPKSEGSQFLSEKGGLEAFKDGLEFDNIGKLRPIYNRNPEEEEVEVYDAYGNTGKVKIRPNVCLVDVGYKLGYGDEYGALIERIKEGDLDALDEILKNTAQDAMLNEYYLHKYHLY